MAASYVFYPVPDTTKMNGGIRGVIKIINDIMHIFLFPYYGRKCGYH